ncbi:Dda-like helicase [Bacillus phage vB_BanS_Skywalker]|uniref:RecD-like DNA helicase n=1 Tax=Bacillus phage vB_BanS_Skywalker TaxID=2894789 RepID=A0AAE9CEF9_9CAUD|nr:Dda-like helicase [Bacillus phage vB_BanS_Skywalker]UGO51189.1 RecD-like DNA helicase [Bacillus phage vB_BanS_Skywalker]
MEKIEIKVIPTKQLFFDSESSFGIYACEVNPEHIDKVKVNNYGNISFKGIAPNLDLGTEYTATVTPDEKSTYRGSYILESIKQERPTTVEEQKNFFKMILTETQVENIFAVYEGQDVIDMIQNDTFDYSKVKGLGDKTYEKMKEKVLMNLDMSELLVFLGKHGIKYNMVSKLLKEYKNPQIVMEKIEENPYVLSKVKGIGFKTCDAIAKAMGYDMKSKHRIRACIMFVINSENQNGHSWIERKQLLNKAIELLNINKSYIDEVLDTGFKHIVNIDTRYATRKVYEAEAYVAMKMSQFKTQSKKLFETDFLDNFLDDYCERNGVELEENQRQFFHDWNENNLLLLIGGGGMGKSWLQRILLELIDLRHYKTALLAPTGKASKVMTGYTGREASTIHRKIGSFDEDEEANLSIEEDVIIVDESSMCDVSILSKLFGAITNYDTRILFVGDDFQLPSVGVGNFLYDAINSGCVKISRLKKVFRQKDGGILDVSTDVRNGKKFFDNDLEGRKVFGKDCVFHLVDQDYVFDGIVHHYSNVIKRFDPEEVVVLSPTKKGKLGTVRINKAIQEIINPASPTKKEHEFGHEDSKTIFRVGDSVMNTVNMYNMTTVTSLFGTLDEMLDNEGGGTADVFNGDTGKIVAINEEDKTIIVDFEGVVIRFKFEDAKSTLIHSWAMTIHKSQGSQYKVVIVVVDKSMKYQLNANLIYTGLSRAKSFLLVLGQAEAVNHGIGKFANMERRSFLQEMLRTYDGNPSASELLEEFKDTYKAKYEGEDLF